MAPEQVDGTETDARTDVYALGTVLFELLTGMVPFKRPNTLATMFAQKYEPPPPPSAFRPELAGSLDEVLARALAKAPDDRFASAGHLARAAEDAVAATARDEPSLERLDAAPRTSPRKGAPTDAAPPTVIARARQVARSPLAPARQLASQVVVWQARKSGGSVIDVTTDKAPLAELSYGGSARRVVAKTSDGAFVFDWPRARRATAVRVESGLECASFSVGLMSPGRIRVSDGPVFDWNFVADARAHVWEIGASKRSVNVTHWLMLQGGRQLVRFLQPQATSVEVKLKAIVAPGADEQDLLLLLLFGGYLAL
jgi:hypothetical protein